MLRMIRSALVVLTLAAAAAASAASQDILLSFATLPSAQGFAYNAAGAHAGVAEGTVFSVAGGVLTQNTIGQYVGTTGAGLYYAMPGIVSASESSELHVTARCLQVQGSSVYPAGQGGLTFAIANGSVQYAFTLTPTGVYVQGAGGWLAVAGSYDNTQFADWTLGYVPPSACRLYRNGTLVSSTTGGAALAVNRLAFGDFTGGANARAEVTAFHFLQGTAVATEGTTFGSVKALFR
jgi:hypothetical protein